MDTPVRKYQKQKDYQRHKLFRKMKRRRRAAIEQAKDAPMKQLRRKLKIPKFEDGKDDKPNVFQLADGTFVNSHNEPLEVLDYAGVEDPTKWTYVDKKGNRYTPKATRTLTEGEQFTQRQIENEQSTRPFEFTPYIEGANEGAAAASLMMGFPFNMAGSAYYTAKASRDAYNRNYLGAALNGLGAVTPAGSGIYDRIKLAIENYRQPLKKLESSVIRTVQDNGKIRLSLPTHTDSNPRQFVLEPQGNNKFYVHMRTWDGDHVPANLSNEDKQTLFQALYDELPDGAEILFPKSGPGYYGTRGTVAGLQRLARDSRFTPGTKGTLQYLDKDGKTVKTYEGTSFIKTPRITAENAANITPESPLIASAMPDYSSELGLDYNMLGKYINEDGSLRKVHISKTVTENPSNNIDYSNVFKVDPDKRFMIFEPGSFINYDIGSMSIDDVVKTFGPEAEYYKKLYDVAKAHNFEGKYAEIGKNAEYNILNRFAIDKSDPDVARGIEEARRIYSIPEYRERFNKWGTLGDTFVDDATARINNVKLQGRSKKLDIKGQHGVHGGAYTSPDATTIGITNSDSSDWIYNMIRHETNHVGHGLIKQPSWMSYHNEKIRPVLREGKDTTSTYGKYLDEMDEIVERSKTAVEYADRIRKEGESLNDALTRLADMADANIYDASIPSDIRQMMARFTKNSTLNFWKNFVGGVATPVGIGYGLMNEPDNITFNKGKDSGIHIKPENRGKFNALKKRTGKTTEQLTHSKNPLTRKRAIFAQNAKKWKH